MHYTPPRDDVMVSCRLPRALVEALKQYASQPRCSLSELIRAGGDMRLEAHDVPGRSLAGKAAGVNAPLLHTQIQDTIRATIVEVLRPGVPQDRTNCRGAARSETPALSRGRGVTDVSHHTAPLSPASSGMTGVLQGEIAYDATKFYLGKLCKRGHDYQGTGQSLLRRHNNGCPQCHNALKRKQRAQRQQRGASPTVQNKEPVNG